jgi:SAM-dependent methyltransferase
MPNEPKTNAILIKLAEYEAQGKSTKPLYDKWSQNYENDLVNNLGYTAHSLAAQALTKHLPNRHASIIDIGCGTGLVGLELTRLGFTTIDGIDISEDMISFADAKAIYRNLVTGDMNAHTHLADQAYDAAICAGSFAPGHLGPESYREILRLVRSGSPIVIFMNGIHFIKDHYQAHIEALEKEGLWQLIDISEHNYMSALERPGRLIITRKT